MIREKEARAATTHWRSTTRLTLPVSIASLGLSSGLPAPSGGKRVGTETVAGSTLQRCDLVVNTSPGGEGEVMLVAEATSQVLTSPCGLIDTRRPHAIRVALGAPKNARIWRRPFWRLTRGGASYEA